jgi:Mn-dependent DtxR family transcriptional regulator
MKGTIFEKSTTSLELWFYAIYLLTSTHCAISAKQLERELGVGYKTAHRMIKRLRPKLLGDRDEQWLRLGREMVKSSGPAPPTQEPEPEARPG